MSCRLPGAPGVAALWDLLVSGGDAVTPVPADRFDVDAHYAPAPGTPGRTASRHGGFLDDVHGFDAAFFGISPVEARSMDPQQRLLLQVVWEALEAAGIRPSSLAGSRSGVFVGQATSEYAETGPAPEHRGVRDVAGNRIRAVTAGRISYALDLRGPSVVLDTACSSSLVAVHAARQSLLTGESDLAIAGGVNVILSPGDAIAYSQGAMLSPGGRCQFGDAAGDGFVRSEGVAAIVLKRLPDALRDGDPVLALLLGSSVTNDGAASGLLLQPSVEGQVHMLREACRSAGTAPHLLDYVEAHGTGTPVGDRVELQALAAAVAGGRDADRPLLTGSVKTNIGHAEAAAGLAGLIKAVLITRHGTIPASLHYDRPHALLADGSLPVEVVRENRPLPRAGSRALVGVSSFGLSGTNAHAVIGEYVPEVGTEGETGVGSEGETGVGSEGETGVGSEGEVGVGAGVAAGVGTEVGVGTEGGTGAERAPGSLPEPASPAASGELPRRPHLLVLSAGTRAALLRLAAAHADHLDLGGAGRELPLRDLCATAATRRDAHPFRLWVVGETHADFVTGLRALVAGEPLTDGGFADAGVAGPRRTVFVFPGQGSQWLGMGRGLYASSPAFRAALDACDRHVDEELGWSVVELLHRDADAFPAEVERVQPALWALQVALVAAWRELGVEPDLCIGHSMGEVAAAHAAGALTQADAASVICRRSRLMKRSAGRGAMLATELSATDARHLVERHDGRVCVAAENAPTSTVLAGYEDALAAVQEELRAADVFHRRVKVNVASHSPLMDELRADLLAELAHLKPVGTTTGMISTVRGTVMAGPELTASYWADNLRQAVRFTGTVEAVAREEESVFVEISPHPILLAALQETLAFAAAGHDTGAAVASVRRDTDEARELVRAVGRFWASGGEVDWSRWYSGREPVVELPSYPWDLTEFRHQPLPRTSRTGASAPLHVDAPLASLGLHDWGTGVRLHGIAPVPPAVHLATLLSSARDALPGSMFRLAEVSLGTELLDLTDCHDVVLRSTIRPPDARGVRRAAVEARRPGSDQGTVCASAELHEIDGTDFADGSDLTDASDGSDGSDGSDLTDGSGIVDSALGRCHRYLAAADFEDLAALQGYEIGEAFRAVEQLWRRNGEAVARMRRPKAPAPAAWESGLQPLLAAWPAEQGPYVPVGFAGVDLHAELPDEFWSVCSFSVGAGDSAEASGVLIGTDGRVLARFSGVRMRRLRLRTGNRPGGAPAETGIPGLVRAASRSAGRGAQAVLARGRAAVTAFRTPVPTQVPAVRERVRTTAIPPTAPAPEPPSTVPVASGRAQDAVRVRAAAVLGMAPADLDGRRPLRDHGLDSLMAAQLQLQLRRECGIEISAGRLLGAESLAAIERGQPA